MLVGPHLPVPVYANGDTIHTLSELGVILLMFSLGLEFSLRKFLQVGVTAGLTALIETSVLIWLGFMVARAFGWTIDLVRCTRATGTRGCCRVRAMAAADGLASARWLGVFGWHKTLTRIVPLILC